MWKSVFSVSAVLGLLGTGAYAQTAANTTDDKCSSIAEKEFEYATSLPR